MDTSKEELDDIEMLQTKAIVQLKKAEQEIAHILSEKSN